jgi:hypothetical protein
MIGKRICIYVEVLNNSAGFLGRENPPAPVKLRRDLKLSQYDVGKHLMPQAVCFGPGRTRPKKTKDHSEFFLGNSFRQHTHGICETGAALLGWLLSAQI